MNHCIKDIYRFVLITDVPISDLGIVSRFGISQGNPVWKYYIGLECGVPIKDYLEKGKPLNESVDQGYLFDVLKESGKSK